MMFSTLARRSLLQNGRQQLVNNSRRTAASGPPIPASALNQWYNAFGKSNITYVGFVVVGMLVVETMYGFTTDLVWNTVNQGKTFETVDWTKFIVEDDDDDDDEDDEDEEGESGDDDDDE
uniref:Uncharacterized protein n=1 Tax=Leptocylindrus danicus TaxID=163516 RepID=A0A6U2P6T3_9STRA|mmetsp:Transcript_24052/g.36093  ORF Transcript_24052/g.36093 Transcript_24052/m.36093 type:complete len:120 (+) Transcript_24052:27-386(+)